MADYTAARHENGALSMADGYSRACGEVSACALTKGPGLTNAVTALTTAARARTPLVVVVGDTPTWGGRHFQDIVQADVVASTGAGFQPVRAPAAAHEDTMLALARAVRERRPVVLNAPADVLAGECGDPPETAGRALEEPAPLTPPRESVAALAQVLSAAQRPLILAGHGAVRAVAKDALLALREQVGGMCATTLRGKGIFEGDEHDLGVLGGFEKDASREALRAADCVVGFGASMNRLTLKNNPAATLVQCGDDPASFGAFLDADLTVLGDARLVAEEVTELLRGERPGRVDRPGQWQGIAMPWDEAEDADRPRVNQIMRACDKALPRDRNVVVDVGHFMGWPVQELSVPDGRSFVCSGDFGAIGLGVGTAVGRSGLSRRHARCAPGWARRRG